MTSDIFTKIGIIIVFLFAGMGIGMLVLWAVEKFIKYTFKHLGLYKVLIDFIFEYKQFKQWKNEND